MRLSSLALLKVSHRAVSHALLACSLLVLQYSPASAQALPLADSLVVGAWDFNTEEFPMDTSVEGEIRFAGFFTPQHTFELTMWAKYGEAADSQEVYKGLHMTGTWFVRDTLLGLITATCAGFTEPGRQECDTEFDELGDTDYVSLQDAEMPILGQSRIMQPAEGWKIPLLRFEGSERDMKEPDFWEVPTHALRRDTRALRTSLSQGAAIEAPAFDALGRMPSGQAPARLYRMPVPVPSRDAR